MVSSVIQGSVSGRNNVGILELLKGAKFAIKEWTGYHSNLPRKAMSMLEREIQDLELVQNQGNEDLSIARKIVVLVNGVPIDRFPIVKGMRQGFSFSSMLFNIVGEALNQLVTKAVEAGLFSGFLIGKRVGQTRVSHLQFVDDLMILCDASLEQVLNVKRVLRVFEIVSGLQLNLKKVRYRVVMWFKARLPELECSADSRISDLSLESKLLMCKKKL
ncbi:hypothetical protein V6N12_033923 [Hibiscus sabdariffa]|uniref:Reverse transcriptase domain-containing protein n=1 Tax=Hibiscus sabdariffa TaxID=183260 RepID=A0ABR2AF35_9ROSI